MTSNPVPFDRFQVAAAVDRLIYGDDATFDPADACLLLEQLPHRKTPWMQLGIAGKFSGGSRRGYAAGVGDVKIKDDKDRQFEYLTGGDKYLRAGQWKLMWIGGRGRQCVEIEQVMSDATEDGRGALISYDSAGTPQRMDIRYNRSLRLLWSPIVLVFPGWKAWKLPALPQAQGQSRSMTMPS